jgi:murein DD-endopeptidase MepM/ murein hydrolase activator NlpD
MKRVLHPVGNALTTAALGSMVLNLVAPVTTLANSSGQADLSDAQLDEPETGNPENSQEELESSALRESDAISPPEILTGQEFTGRDLTDNVSEADDHSPSEGSLETESSESLTTETEPAPGQGAFADNIAAESLSPLEAARRVVAERLAELVERERPEREAQLRQNLKIAALYYAETGDFERARQTVKNPVLSEEEQAELLTQIEEMETAQAPTVADVEPGDRAPASPVPSLAPVPLLRPERFGYGVRRFCAAGNDDQAIAVNMPDAEDNQKYSPKCEQVAQAGGNLLTFIRNQSFAMLYPLASFAPITSHFGWRIHPIFGDRRFHRGTDFGAPMGTPVVAALPGRVEVADYLGGYGLTVILEHGEAGKKTLYAHLSQLAVAPGTQVEQGMVIGWVGSTGNSTGPHLHFEVHQWLQSGWHAIDPVASAEFVQVEGGLPAFADGSEPESLVAISQIQQVDQWLKLEQENQALTFAKRKNMLKLDDLKLDK